MIGTLLLLLLQLSDSLIYPTKQIHLEREATLLIQSATGEFYLADQKKSRIYHLDADGNLLNEYGGTGSGLQFLNQPAGIWCSNDLKVYVADMNNHRIVILSRELGFIGIINGDDPSGQNLSFRFPKGVVISATGDIFIVDGDERNILKVSASSGRRERIGDSDAGFSLLGSPESLTATDDRLFVFDALDSSTVILDWFGNITGQIPSKNRFPLLIENQLMFVDGSGIVYTERGIRLRMVIPEDEQIVSVFVRGITVSILTNRSVLIATILAP